MQQRVGQLKGGMHATACRSDEGGKLLKRMHAGTSARAHFLAIAR